MCQKCLINPVYEFTNKRKVCSKCYNNWFEKKFLYTLRKFNMIKKGDIVFISKKEDFYFVLNKLFHMLSKKLPITLQKQKSKKSKIAVSITSDDISYDLIEQVLSKINLNKLKPINKNIIKPLYLFKENEVEIYAKINNLKIKKKKQNKRIKLFIDSLEKKHPEIKNSIVSTFLSINN
jgi:hypothetical protein